MNELDSATVRIAVLENLCLAALTLALGNIRNDRDAKLHVIDLIQRQIEESIAYLPQGIREHGVTVANDLLGRVRRSLSDVSERQPAGRLDNAPPAPSKDNPS